MKKSILKFAVTCFMLAIASILFQNCSGSSINGSSAKGASIVIGSGSSSASALAAKLGRANRLLVGLDANLSDIQSQSLKPDIYDRYLVGVGANSWPTWNSPSGDYVNVVASGADQVGAAP